MYISRVRLKNIRGFSGRRNVDLTLTRPDGSHAGWTVLAGRNGSGKTSLLRAIALTVGGPGVAPGLIPDLRTWMTVGMKASSSVLQLVTAPEDFQPDSGERVKDLTLEMVSLVDPDREMSRPNSQPGTTYSVFATSPSSIDQVHRAMSPWQADPIGWFCAGYGPFRRLVGGSGEAQRLMSTPGPAARLASLFFEDASLTEGVQWLIDMHLRALEGKNRASELGNAAIRILADGLLPDHYKVSEVDSDGIWVISRGNRFPLREMSDGYRSIAALVVDLIKLRSIGLFTAISFRGTRWRSHDYRPRHRHHRRG